MAGENKAGNRIEEGRMGRVWSLCWIALEIGSINLHTASHKCNDADPYKHETGGRLSSPRRQRCGATCVPARTAGSCGRIVCCLLVYFIRQKDTRAVIALHIGPLVPPKHHSGRSPVSQNNSRLLVPLYLRVFAQSMLPHSFFIQYMHVFGCFFGCLYALVLDPAKD